MRFAVGAQAASPPRATLRPACVDASLEQVFFRFAQDGPKNHTIRSMLVPTCVGLRISGAPIALRRVLAETTLLQMASDVDF